MRCLTARLTAAALFLLVAAAADVRAQAPASSDIPDLGGKLYRAVFVSGPGMLTTKDLPSIAEPLRSRLSEFLTRRAAFKSRYRGSPDSIQKVRVDAKRRDLERAIVSLIAAPGVEDAAAAFAAAAPLSYEWQGLPDGPLAEAEYAEAVLSKGSSSALAPFLIVFIAHRQRVTYEAYEAAKNTAGMQRAAAKYREYLSRVMASSDPIFAALAADMDKQKYVYIKSSSHPNK